MWSTTSGLNNRSPQENLIEMCQSKITKNVMVVRPTMKRTREDCQQEAQDRTTVYYGRTPEIITARDHLVPSPQSSNSSQDGSESERSRASSPEIPLSVINYNIDNIRQERPFEDQQCSWNQPTTFAIADMVLQENPSSYSSWDHGMVQPVNSSENLPTDEGVRRIPDIVKKQRESYLSTQPDLQEISGFVEVEESINYYDDSSLEPTSPMDSYRNDRCLFDVPEPGCHIDSSRFGDRDSYDLEEERDRDAVLMAIAAKVKTRINDMIKDQKVSTSYSFIEDQLKSLGDLDKILYERVRAALIDVSSAELKQVSKFYMVLNMKTPESRSLDVHSETRL